MFDFTGITRKLSEAKAEIEEAQKALSKEVFTSEAGGGLVLVSVAGDYRVVELKIDPQLFSEPETLRDLVIAATNLALKKVEEARKELLKQSASSVLPQIPGLDLSKFL